MQTRKRAKSVTFGKPKKEESLVVEKDEKELSAVEEKTEKEDIKATSVEEKETPEKVVEKSEKEDEPQEPTEAAKKVMDLEESPKDDEEKSELSSVLTPVEKVEEEKEPELSSSLSPASDDGFTTDAPSSKDAPEPTLSTPIIEDSKSESSTEAAPASPSDSDLSSTPPPSAFSLQESGDGDGDLGGGKIKNFLVYFLVIALFSFILGIGAMALLASGLLPVSLPKDLSFISQVQNVVQPSPTAAPTSVPQPTVAPTAKPVDLKEFTISVLNGSGIRGKAADVQETLKTAGFTVNSTGNADRSTYTKTQISAKKEVSEEYLDQLQKELEKEFVVEVASAPAPASQTTDVVVILGRDTAED